MDKDSISSKLQELFDLYKSGALDKEEYESIKSDIIYKDGGKSAKEKLKENKIENQAEELKESLVEIKTIEKNKKGFSIF